jgi:hypothetical protein
MIRKVRFGDAAVRVIFSCENTPYMRWQSELLHYTYSQSGMQSQLTALVSATEEPLSDFTCETFPVANYKNCISTETYAPLNKPGGIAEWAATEGPEDATTFIVDPDSAFLRPVQDPGPLRPGEAYADAHDYMVPELPFNQKVLQRHCRRAVLGRVQPVGIYLLMRRDDLAALAPLWLQKAIDIKSDRVCMAGMPSEGWISEMLAYAIAAAELGIWHHISELAQTTGSNSLRRPIIHYCFPLNASGAAWHKDQQEPVLWSKWAYKPWDHPPVEEAATSDGRELLLRLATLAASNRG